MANILLNSSDHTGDGSDLSNLDTTPIKAYFIRLHDDTTKACLHYFNQFVIENLMGVKRSEFASSLIIAPCADSFDMRRYLIVLCHASLISSMFDKPDGDPVIDAFRGKGLLAQPLREKDASWLLDDETRLSQIMINAFDDDFVEEFKRTDESSGMSKAIKTYAKTKILGAQIQMNNIFGPESFDCFNLDNTYLKD